MVLLEVYFNSPLFGSGLWLAQKGVLFCPQIRP